MNKLLCWLILALLLVFTMAVPSGCSTISYRNPVKDVQVDAAFFLVDPKVQNVERVWAASDYFSIGKAGLPVSEKGHELAALSTRAFIEILKLWMSGELPMPVRNAPPD